MDNESQKQPAPTKRATKQSSRVRVAVDALRSIDPYHAALRGPLLGCAETVQQGGEVVVLCIPSFPNQSGEESDLCDHTTVPPATHAYKPARRTREGVDSKPHGGGHAEGVVHGEVRTQRLQQAAVVWDSGNHEAGVLQWTRQGSNGGHQHEARTPGLQQAPVVWCSGNYEAGVLRRALQRKERKISITRRAHPG